MRIVRVSSSGPRRPRKLSGRHLPSRFALCAALIAVPVLGISAPSQATNFSGATTSGCNAVNMADDFHHTYFYDSLTQRVQGGMEAVRVNLLDPTRMGTVVLSAPSGLTDVIVHDEDYVKRCGIANWDDPTGNIWGMAPCVSITSDGRCESHFADFDLSDIPNMTNVEVNAVACHETGHTVGLEHPESDA